MPVYAETFLIKTCLAQAPLITALFKKIVFGVVTSEEISSNRQVFNPSFVDNIKGPYTHKVYDKSQLVMQAHNNEKKISCRHNNQ